jgi:hypothetical protein
MGAMSKLGLCLVAALATGLACGASSTRKAGGLTAPPAPTTVATLAGPLCDGAACTCRDPDAAGDGGAGTPDDGVKRFEVRLGPSEHELWLTVDDMVLYKSRARAEECFYVDLPAGDHRFTFRAANPGGVSAAVAISEYAPATSSWYASYRFECGAPGVCAYDDLETYRGTLERYVRGIHDPCGSVKVKGLTWDTDLAPDTVHPGNLAVHFTFDVFDFTPKRPHGDPACAEKY